MATIRITFTSAKRKMLTTPITVVCKLTGMIISNQMDQYVIDDIIASGNVFEFEYYYSDLMI